jgi:pyruvate dehydrogenase E2 component (dihydrolipoamide acetyltransferase)
VEEQTITAWFRKEGDRVAKGEPLAEITTSKAVFELEAPRSGTLLRIVAPVKSEVPVGYVVAFLGEPGEPVPDISGHNARLLERSRQAAAGRKAAAPRAAAPASAAPAPGAVRATPAARRLARERGLDIAAVQKKLQCDIVTEALLASYLAGRKDA